MRKARENNYNLDFSQLLSQNFHRSHLILCRILISKKQCLLRIKSALIQFLAGVTVIHIFHPEKKHERRNSKAQFYNGKLRTGWYTKQKLTFGGYVI